MEETNSPQIMRAEKIGDGLLIYFDDGKTGFYPTFLLRATLPQAIEVESMDLDEE
jgi:hypothetical protein